MKFGEGTMLTCTTVVFVFISWINVVFGSYPCLCCYQIQTTVYKERNISSGVLGNIYEFECKPTFPVVGTGASSFIAIQFEKQIGYIENVPGYLSIETCPGTLPSSDAATSPPTAFNKTPTTTPTSTTTTTTTTTTPTPPATATSSTKATPTTTITTTTSTTITPTPPATATSSTKAKPTPTITASSLTTTTPTSITTTPSSATTTPTPPTTTTTSTKATLTPITTTKTPTKATPSPTIAANCTPGWVRRDQSCYLFHFHDKVSHSTASERCHEKGAHLAFVDSEEKQQFVSFHLGLRHVYRQGVKVWIGGVYTDQQWQWFNGLTNSRTPFVYNNWSHHFPRHHDNHNETCTAISGSFQSQWLDYFCSDKFFYVCELSLTHESSIQQKTTKQSVYPATSTTKPITISPTTMPKETYKLTTVHHPDTIHTAVCPTGWINEKTSCYFFNLHDRLEHTKASDRCSHDNAHLVFIESEEEQHFISSYLHDNYNIFSTHHGHDEYNTAVWTGGMQVDRHWKWVDGGTNHKSSFHYDHWSDDFPRHHTRHDTCTAIVGTMHGDWIDFACNDEFFYICERSISHTRK